MDIQRLLSRMDETTMFEGLCNQRPIASRMQSLLLTELEDMGQGAFAQRVEAEYMGERKGLHIRGALNPGLPNHTNAQERAMRDFKEAGKVLRGC